MDKLNRLPTFAIVDAAGNFVGAEDDQAEIVFFIDAAEASEALDVTRAAHEDEEGTNGWHLAAVPLGSAFQICGGWCDEQPPPPSRFVLRGPRAAVEAKGDEGRAQLAAMGLKEVAASSWVVPLYMSDDFQVGSPGSAAAEMFPVFFSESGLHAGWVRAGRPPEEAALLVHTVMELRVLALNMVNSGQMPWARFQLVSSEEAYKLAQTLQEEAAARAGSGGE